MKYASLYRFWDVEHENGHEKAWLVADYKEKLTNML